MAAHRHRPTGPFLIYFEAVLLHETRSNTTSSSSHQALIKHLIDRLLSATMMTWLSCEKLALWLVYELSTCSCTSSSSTSTISTASTDSIPLPEELKLQLNSTSRAATNFPFIYQNTLLPQMETAVNYLKDIQTWKEAFVDQMGLDLMDYYYVGEMEYEDNDGDMMVDAYKYQAILANYSKLVDAVVHLLVEQVAKDSPLLFHILLFQSVETSATGAKDVKQSEIGTLLEQVRNHKGKDDDGSSISVLQRIEDSSDKLKGVLQGWYKTFPEVVPDVLSLGLLNQPAQSQDQDQNSLGKPGLYGHAHAHAQGLDEATTCSETTASSDDCGSNNDDDDDDEEEQEETCTANTTTADSNSSSPTRSSGSGSRVVQYLRDRHPGMLIEVDSSTTNSSDESTTASSNSNSKTFGFQPKDHQADMLDSITIDAAHSCLAQHTSSILLVVDLLATLVGEIVVELK